MVAQAAATAQPGTPDNSRYSALLSSFSTAVIARLDRAIQ
jgi:hypothetical protein